ncbi:ABC transporter permease [Paenibacillus arenilitoris]|uniref:Sugar ABC transporter permease n=1 Tax=Paenibacillus arenilitoris TaxID=2772299 RepID=A0A927CN47_9BACL|nr:ABC transporter permease subunit [Paenibacillus arenilitoris]MBD2868645.1 sugar ABC transporter permease [Paenibacillus arenilitoris]
MRASVTGTKAASQSRTSSAAAQYIKRSFPIYLMVLPGLLLIILFKYLPMFGIAISFQQYSPFRGIWGSEWVGFDHFVRLFTEQQFVTLLKNTLILNLIDICFFFPAPIVFALILNEVRLRWFKATLQTVVYLPHFISMIVVVGITVILFASEFGGINQWLDGLGLPRYEGLNDPDHFRWIWLLQNIWKEVGWSAIIYLAALASIDPTLYEAAKMDGANRWRQIWHITLPSLTQVILILFILRLGSFIDIGFEHIFLLQNPLNLAVSDVFDTYIYRIGVQQGEFSYTTAVGLFKSVVGLVLVLAANAIAKRSGKEGVY